MNVEKMMENAEFNRFGIISVVILLIGCLGGLTAGMGAALNSFSLILVLIPTMTTLSLLLAVAPMKLILQGTAVCILVDVILMTYYAIS